MSEVIQGIEHRPLIVGRTLFDYADVFASQQALPHVDMVKNLLREARAQCKGKTKS